MTNETETGIPIREDWDPLSEAYLRDPYGISRKLREETPIFFAPSIGYYVVNRMSDVMQTSYGMSRPVI